MGRVSALLPSTPISSGDAGRSNAASPCSIRPALKARPAPSASSQAPWGKKMGQLSQKHPTCVVSRQKPADREVLAQRVIAFLRTMHPHKMPESVAALTGISPHTIRKLEERHSAPSAVVLDAMGEAYGPEFLHAVFGWRWLDAYSRAQKLNEIDARRMRIEEDQRALAR